MSRIIWITHSRGKTTATNEAFCRSDGDLGGITAAPGSQ